MNLLEEIIKAITDPFRAPDTQRNYVLMGATQGDLDRIALEENVAVSAHEQMAAVARAVARNTCGFCGEQAKIQVFKETGYCSENHRKALAAGVTSASEVAVTEADVNQAEPEVVPVDESESNDIPPF